MATPAWFNRVPDSPGDTPSSAAPSPINSKKLEFLGEPEPRALRPAALSRHRAKTPTVTAAVAAASLMASSIQTPSARQIVISPPESARPSASVAGGESGVPHRDAVLADVVHSDVASDDAALGDWRSTIEPVQADSPEPARKKRTVLYTSVGVAAVAIAGLLMLRPSAGDDDRIHRDRRGGDGGRNARRVAPLRERDARAYRSGGPARAASAGERSTGERSTGAPPGPRRGSPGPHKNAEHPGAEHPGGAERRLDRAFGNGAARVRHRSDWNGE
jgi:hypothetical protein